MPGRAVNGRSQQRALKVARTHSEGKKTRAQEAASQATRNPKPEKDTPGDPPREQARIWDGHHVTNRSLEGRSGCTQGETCEYIHGEQDEGI